MRWGRSRPRILGQVWDDEPHDRGRQADGSSSRDRESRDVSEGDDLVPYNGSGNESGGFGFADGDGTGTGGPQSAKGKAALLLVVILAIMTTVALCCVAIGRLASLIDVDPARF